jgi:hypothetical protein
MHTHEHGKPVIKELEYPASVREGEIPYILFRASPYVTRTNRLDADFEPDKTQQRIIRIAIPPQLSSQDSFNYETTSLLKTEAFSNLMNLNFGDAAANTFAALVNDFGPDGAKQATQSLTGRSINPKEELLFNSPSLRSHSFTFNMFARNRDEGTTIVDIIKKFRELAYPDTGILDNDKSKTFYQFPHQFSISQHPHRKDNGFPVIREVVCTSIDVNYGGGGRTVLTVDDYFQAIELTVTFQDLRAMTSDTIGTRLEKDSKNV